MSWSDTNFLLAFDAEAGDIATLATSDQKMTWFNQGQGRLLRKNPKTDDITWIEGDRSVALENDFLKLDKIVTADGYTAEPWRVWGSTLVLDDPAGATGAGAARVYYWAEWTDLTAAVDSILTNAEDYACLYFALSRFYKKLSSNRAYYKRYATLVGANAVTMSDLQQESDRYYQDFLDSRDDIEPDPPAYFYND